MFLLTSDKRNKLSDRELVERFRYSYDNAYIGILFQRYTHLLFGVCMKYLKNEERAKDAVMDVFEKVMADLRRHDVEDFRPWIHTVTKNHCLMGLRAERSKQNRHGDYVHYIRMIVETDEPLHLNGTAQAQADNELYAAIEQLKDGQRECVRLFYFEGKSYEQVEQITGFTYNEVKSHIQNGKRNLRIRLSEKSDE